MTIQYDSKGIITQNLIEIIEERENNLKPILGLDFNIDKTTPIGNMELADANNELAIQELIAWLFPAQMDATTAEGIFLDAICEKNRIKRYQARKTTVDLIIKGTPKTSFTAGDIIIQDNVSGEYYDLNEDCTIDDNGQVIAEFICEENGEYYPTQSSTLTIQTPLDNLDSILLPTENINITIGRLTETDEQLRRRRDYSIEKTSTNTLGSIRALLYSTDGVQHVRSFENDTEEEKDGLPMKSFEFVVDGGDEDDITDVIFKNKTLGTRAYGTTTKLKTDSDGNIYSIGFTKAKQINVGIRIRLSTSNLQSTLWETEIKNALKDKFDIIQEIGTKVKNYTYYSVLTKFSEITDIESIEFFNADLELPEYYSQYEINSKEIAKLDINNINIITSIG